MANYKILIFAAAAVFASQNYQKSAKAEDSFYPFLKERNSYSSYIGKTLFSIEERILEPKEKLAEIRCGTINETEVSIGKKYSVENSLTESEEDKILAAIEAELEMNNTLSRVKTAIDDSKKRRSSTDLIIKEGKYYQELQKHKIKPLLCFHQIVFQNPTIRETDIKIQNPSWWLLGSLEVEELENIEYTKDPHMSIEAYPTDTCSRSCRAPEEYEQFGMRGEVIESLKTTSNLPIIGGESAQGDHVLVAIGKDDEKFYLPIYVMSDIDQDDTIRDLKNTEGRPWIEVFVRAGSEPREGIRSAQRRLQGLGYQLTVDGVMGPETAAAIRSFQRNNALDVTGQLDSPTKSALLVDE